MSNRAEEKCITNYNIFAYYTCETSPINTVHDKLINIDVNKIHKLTRIGYKYLKNTFFVILNRLLFHSWKYRRVLLREAHIISIHHRYKDADENSFISNKFFAVSNLTVNTFRSE